MDQAVAHGSCFIQLDTRKPLENAGVQFQNCGAGFADDADAPDDRMNENVVVDESLLINSSDIRANRIGCLANVLKSINDPDIKV